MICATPEQQKIFNEAKLEVLSWLNGMRQLMAKHSHLVGRDHLPVRLATGIVRAGAAIEIFNHRADSGLARLLVAGANPWHELVMQALLSQIDRRGQFPLDSTEALGNVRETLQWNVRLGFNNLGPVATCA